MDCEVRILLKDFIYGMNCWLILRYVVKIIYVKIHRLKAGLCSVIDGTSVLITCFLLVKGQKENYKFIWQSTIDYILSGQTGGYHVQI